MCERSMISLKSIVLTLLLSFHLFTFVFRKLRSQPEDSLVFCSEKKEEDLEKMRICNNRCIHIWLSCNPGDLLFCAKFYVENVFDSSYSIQSCILLPSQFPLGTLVRSPCLNFFKYSQCSYFASVSTYLLSPYISSVVSS